MRGASFRSGRGKPVDQSAQPRALRHQIPFILHHKLLRRRRIPAHRFLVPHHLQLRNHLVRSADVKVIGRSDLLRGALIDQRSAEAARLREILSSPDLTEAEAEKVTVLSNDGAADSARVLAGLWTRWMAAAAANGDASVLASTPLRPYAHQSNAVYGAMLPQPRLRFLLADEPGTGKTIMAGLYLREMQKRGLVRRALVVCPAGLVMKWQADFRRFFGGELRRITNETVQQHGLSDPHDMWVVSLELAGINPAVQEAIRPDRAGWDVVVFDEAHRLTPTAGTFYQVGRLLAKNTPRTLLMTATPHRGSEWLFRHLLHLVEEICTRVIIMDRGNKIADGTVAARFRPRTEPDDPEVLAAIEANLPGSVV